MRPQRRLCPKGRQHSAALRALTPPSAARSFACLLWFIAANSDHPERSWAWIGAEDKFGSVPGSVNSQYAMAIYWTLTTMITGGFGDFTPMTQQEMLVAMVYVLTNFCLNVYIIGNVTELVTQMDEHTREFQQAFKHLGMFMDAHGLAEDVRRDLRSYMLLKFNAREEHEEIIVGFPPVFRARLFRYMYRPVIQQAYLLEGVSEAFIDTLACELLIEIFMPGIVIVSQYDAGARRRRRRRPRWRCPRRHSDQT